MPLKDYIGFCILIALVLLMPHLVANDYYLGVLVFTAFNCLACIGLCLLMGYAGQISLGHGAFIAIGAYSSGVLTTMLDWSPWTAMAAGALASMAIAFAVGIPTLRLKGHYLAMATLGFASIIHIIAVAATEITGGPAGLLDIPRLGLFGYSLDSDVSYYYFAWFAVVAGLYFAFNLVHSRVGRGLRAIHGSEDAASAVGINTNIYKIQVFALSAVYASVSGSLYAYYVNYIDPGPFDVMHSIVLVTMVAVGGLRHLWGALIGAVLLSLLPELLSMAAAPLKVIGIAYKPDYDILVYGGILLLIMMFLPEGLFAGLASASKSGTAFLMKLIKGGSIVRQ
ncbi:MAG: branched-chain amino acid ABC transporter permease [Desulfobacteraceae bacterium]|nr:branched-chain amino acid ABC transporter permease [Desulfobacteraceae bacterium]